MGFVAMSTVSDALNRLNDRGALAAVKTGLEDAGTAASKPELRNMIGGMLRQEGFARYNRGMPSSRAAQRWSVRAATAEQAFADSDLAPRPLRRRIPRTPSSTRSTVWRPAVRWLGLERLVFICGSTISVASWRHAIQIVEAVPTPFGRRRANRLGARGAGCRGPRR